MDWTEVAGTVTGALCVWLVVRQHVANFPIGIANNVFFIALFVPAGLYADAGLQVAYVVLAFYGWWWWSRGGPGRTELDVSRSPGPELRVVLATTVVATLALTAVLEVATDSTVALGDALTTVLSLSATYLLSRKRVESWWFWIVADVLYVGLYWHKDLHLTAVLYAGFLCLCVAGLVSWQRSLRRDLVPA